MKVIAIAFLTFVFMGCLSVADEPVTGEVASAVTEEVDPGDDPNLACVFGDNGDFACCNHGCCWGVVGDQHIHTCGEGMVAAAEDAASAPLGSDELIDRLGEPLTNAQWQEPPWDDPQLSCTFWGGGDFVCCLNQGCCWFVDGNTYGWSCPQ